MNIEKITNPRHTYDGYFETYFIRPFFHRYADFSGRESGRSFLLSLLAWVVVTLGITGIMLGQIGLIGPEAGVTSAIVVECLWGAFSLVPLAALVGRVSHGAPGEEPKPRMLGVDTLLGVSCLLFFIFGLLMMITTLDSENLDPNSRYVPEKDTAVVEDEYVVEEPIFTYQDEAQPENQEEPDSLSDVTEPDLASPEESFDPTIEQIRDPVLSDTL